MTSQDTNLNPVANGRDNQLNAVKIQLRSQRASDFLRGMNQVRQWLQENIEDGEVYGILLDAVQENRDKREQVRNLLIEMMQKGANSAVETMSLLPSSVQDLLADADDAYYAAENDKAIQLYRQVLKLDPENARAKNHLAEAKYEQPNAGSLVAELPRDAVQYYRRARSYIAARDFLTAMKMLSAAIESAQVKNMNYLDAEQLLNIVQDAFVAEEFKQKASLALEEKQWKGAIDLYKKALALDPTDELIKKELDSLQGLLRAESELQKRGVLKIFSPIGKLQNAFETAKGVVNLDNPLLNFVEMQLHQIRQIRIGGIIALLIITLLISSLSDIFDPFEIFNKPTVESIPLIVETQKPVQQFSVTATATATVTATYLPTTAATITFTPTSTTIPVLGYGKLLNYVYPLKKPNGEYMGIILRKNQPITILERTDYKGEGDIWYKCRWEVNGETNDGWFSEKYIQFGPPPTPTPTPAS